VLDGYYGIVIADGYGAYDALARAGPGFTLVHYWAHARQKFIEESRDVSVVAVGGIEPPTRGL
jgi:hypothetical protein